MSKNHLFSLIIPVYRQGGIIKENLKNIEAALRHIQYPYEIIPVVDGILDNSFEEIKQSGVKNLRAFAYKYNHGKSFAIRLGMQKARGDYVMFIDSGNDIDPEGIVILLGYMTFHDADIVVGSKRHPDSHVEYSWDRKILSYGYYLLIKLLFRLHVRDTQAGIKIFKKEVLEAILPKLLEKKFAGDLEMLVASKRNGFTKIYEAPIKLNYKMGGISSATGLKSILNLFIDTIAIFYRNNVLDYYANPDNHKPTETPADLQIYEN